MSDLTKSELRQTIRALRRDLTDKDERSRRIFERLRQLPRYHAAAVVMFYIDVRSEVRTREALQSELAGQRSIVVPYCDDDELTAWRLESWDKLSPGRFGILEPCAPSRLRIEHQVDPTTIDVILVPGVAFDARGNRLGSGRGFYDRLLPRLRDDAWRIGLAFDCQMVDEVPADAHDVPMDCVVTETGVHGVTNVQ